MKEKKITLRRLLCLMIVSGLIFAPLPVNSQEIPDNAEPLTPNEGRLILGQLYELQTRRAEVETLRAYIERDREQDERERKLVDIQLDNINEKLNLVYIQLDIANERAKLYESLYRAVTAKPSFGCRVAKVVTIGLYRCR